MCRILTLLLLAFVAIAPLAAIAAQPYVAVEQRLTAEQLHATGLDTLTRAQLALLNGILREDEAAKAAVAAPREGEPGAGHAWSIGLDNAPIKSRLVGAITAWEPGTEFTLANGQHWKVLKGHVTLRKPLQDPEVEVFPGIAGRWFLRVEEDMPAPRVYRVD